MALIHGKKIKLFSLNSNRELAQEIAEHLGVELSECEVTSFADGEVNISISETVRGYTVFVVQSTNNPVNENYMQLLVMIDALKRASAKEINVIMPYYGYSRQDRKAAPRQPISAKLMADLLQAAGADRMMCLDLHAAQIQGFFNIPIDNFLALPVLAEYFVEKNLEDVVVVSLGADKMIVNNDVVALDVAPFIENNRTMMQFNVLYVFGIDVEWVAETQSIVAEGNGLKVVMQLGSKVATVNGEEVALDVAPYSVNGRTVVPVGFITGVLDITPTFTYNADGSIADILFTK